MLKRRLSRGNEMVLPTSRCETDARKSAPTAWLVLAFAASVLLLRALVFPAATELPEDMHSSPQAAVAAQCVDLKPGCSEWAADHQCRTNPQFMHHFCGVSCKLCSDARQGGLNSIVDSLSRAALDLASKPRATEPHGGSGTSRAASAVYASQPRASRGPSGRIEVAGKPTAERPTAERPTPERPAGVKTVGVKPALADKPAVPHKPVVPRMQDLDGMNKPWSPPPEATRTPVVPDKPADTPVLPAKNPPLARPKPGSDPWLVLDRAAFDAQRRGGGCEDLHTSCEAWMAAGVCDADPSFMDLGCRRSCHRCPKDALSAQVIAQLARAAQVAAQQ